MGIKYRVEKDTLEPMLATAKSLDGTKVNVGYLDGGELAWLAAIHEYGCRIKVTDKMRAYLHSRGLHLKKSTTEIVIPERSFLRAGFDANHEHVLEEVEQTLPLVLDGSMSIKKYGELIGVVLSSAIKDFARDLKDPPNHPFTIKEKGSSNPLVDTGDMIGALTFEVEL